MDDFDYIPGMFTNSSAAPKIDDYPVKKPAKKQENAESPARRPALTLKKVIAIICAMAAVLAMFSFVIYLNSRIVDNEARISALSSRISQANAENVRLTAQLGSIISADKIQNYAVTVLGMQQAERYQIHYFEDRDGDKVVVAAGRLPNADT